MGIYKLHSCFSTDIIFRVDVLLLCELADGALVCDDPPRPIRWVPIPNKRLNFSCEAVSSCSIRPPLLAAFSDLLTSTVLEEDRHFGADRMVL